MQILTKKRFLAFLLVLMCFMNINFVHGISLEDINNYKVRIHATTVNAVIRVDSSYRIYIDDVQSDYIPSSVKEDLIVEKNNDGLLIKNSKGDVIGIGDEIKLQNVTGTFNYFEVKGIDSKDYAAYPDNVLLRRSSDLSNILVINITSIENYLKGVLPHEMGSGAPLEALKAQAITARTLAVKRIGKYSSEGFNVTNTTSDQVYKGYSKSDFSETSNVYKAVEETKGIVLKYGKALLDGIFYSNNGGQTADDSFVWGASNGSPYYVSKKDPYDTYLNSYVAGWAKLTYSVSYNKSDLKNVILDNSKKYPAYFKIPYCTPSFDGLSDIKDIEIINQVNGYVTSLKITDVDGRVYTFKNYANRWVFGLRSQQFNMNKIGTLSIKSDKSISKSDFVYIKSSNNIVEKSTENLVVSNGNTSKTIGPLTYIFNGRGYGHGIGMSQNGAMNRALDGHTYEQILSFYYEGSSIAGNYGD